MADESKDDALKISSRKDLEGWLKSLPPEQRRGVALAVAARAALRVLPLFATDIWLLRDQVRKGRFSNSIFTTFFATAVARVGAQYPNRTDTLRIYAESAADAAISVNFRAQVNAHIRQSAVQAVRPAMYVHANAIHVDAAVFSADSVEFATFAVKTAARDYQASLDTFLTFGEPTPPVTKSAFKSIWESVSRDANFMGSGGMAEALASKTLWPDGAPEWAEVWWRRLQETLPREDEWQVWIDWYNRRLNGVSDQEEIELVFATVPDKEREAGPAAANKWIKARLEELQKKESPAPPAWDFFISASTLDEADAREVVAVLEQAGHSTFAQFKDIATGNNFVREMQSGLDDSGRMIALYSPEYENSDHCQAEWSAAYNSDPSGKKRKLIPFLLRPTALNSLARQVTYKSLVGLSKEQRKAAILDAIAPKPVVPSRLPATIEPVIADGKIALPANPAEVDIDSETLGAALTALRAQINDLAGDLDVEANIDRRVIGFLRRLAEEIPQAPPTQAKLFMLAHEQETLEAYGKTVVAEWPGLLAGRYLATTLAFDRTVRQFPKWRLFKQNADKNRLNDQQRAEASKLAADFAAALREEDAAKYVASEIADTFEEMCRRLDAARDEARGDRMAAGVDTLAEDAVVSIENTLKLMAETALAGVKRAANAVTKTGAAYVDSFEDGMVDQAKKEGKKDSAALVKWSKRILAGAAVGAGAKAAGIGAVIAKLMVTYPQIGKWLGPIIDLISN